LSRITQLAEQRTTALARAKAILDEAGDKQLTAEQRSAYDRAIEEADDCEHDIVKERRSQEFAEARSANPRLLSPFSPEHNGGPENRAFQPFPGITEYRSLAEGTGGLGGYTVPQAVQPQLLQYLANRTVVLKAGPRVLPMANQVLYVPRITAGTTAAETAEGASITESDPTFNRVTLSAKKYTVFTQASHEVLEDSAVDLRNNLAADMIGQLGRLLDAQFLSGTGTGSPAQMTGIFNAGGTSTSLGTNGATITVDNVADAVARLEGGNANLDNAAVFCSARTWGTLRKAKATGSGDYLITPNPTEAEQRSLFGLPVFVTNSIPNNLTTGSANNCSQLAVVDMSQVVIGQRELPTVEYSLEYAFQSDLVSIKCRARFDIGYNDAANGIQVLTGILP
jgi:HK97 family phage major capsid protein